MEYPLTSVPFAHAQIGGIMNKTDKSMLLHMLVKHQLMNVEKDVNGNQAHIDVTIYEGYVFIAYFENARNIWRSWTKFAGDRHLLYSF